MEVEQHRGRRRAVEGGERLDAVRGDGGLVALAGQQVGERLGQSGLVLDDQDAGHQRAFVRVGAGSTMRGSRMVNVEPRPG